MLNTHKLLLSFLIVSLLSCSRGDGILSDYEIVPIDVTINKRVGMGEIFSNIEIIPLESNKEAYLRRNHKLIVADSLILLKDGSQQTVLVFDKKGKFIANSKKRRGRGANEYFIFNDFNYNRYTGNIEIMNYDNTVLIYDKEFNYIGNFQVPIKGLKALAYSDFFQIDGNNYIFIPSTDTIVMNRYSVPQDKIVNSQKIKKIIRGVNFGERIPFQMSRGKLYYKFNDNSNYLALIDTDRPRVAGGYKYDLGRYEFDPYSTGLDGEAYREYLDEALGRYAFSGNILINDKYLIGRIYYDIMDGLMSNGTKLSIYSLDKKENIVVNNRFEGDKVLMDFHYADNDALYHYCDNFDNLQYIIDESLISEEDISKIRALTDESNSVIVKYILRDDLFD